MRLADLLAVPTARENRRRPLATPATVATGPAQPEQVSQVSQLSQGPLSKLRADPTDAPSPAELRARLADAAEREGVARFLIERLPDAELEGVELLADAGLAALARMIEADADRMQGRVPKGWNQAATCRRCGPIILWPGAPADVLGCPWCVPRSRGVALPRPATTCATCTHQQHQPGTSDAGMHGCAQGHGLLFAHQPHPCADWHPAFSTDGTAEPTP